VGKGGRCLGLTILPPSCFLKSGSLNLLELSGIALPFILRFSFCSSQEMPPAGVEPAIPTSERPQTQTLDREATWTAVGVEASQFNREETVWVLYLFHMRVKQATSQPIEERELQPTDSECCGE
jgi:hypothetical protein